MNPVDQHNIAGESTTGMGTLRSSITGGVVDGKAASTSAEIAGRVTGRVDVREQSVLKGSAVTEGDVYTVTLAVEDGPRYNGRCMVKTSQDKPSLDRVDVQATEDAVSSEEPRARAA